MPRIDILQAVDSVLLQSGFHRRNLTWTRRRGLLIDVVDIQISKAGNTATLNVGVFDEEAHKLVWDKARPHTPHEVECAVRARVGELLDGRDTWWELSDHSGPTQMAEVVKDTVLPFLQKVASREALVAYLKKGGALQNRYPLPAIYVAVLNFLIGRTAEACALLKSLEERGLWADKASEIARRLNCPAD